jgi:hypothetical protein
MSNEVKRSARWSVVRFMEVAAAQRQSGLSVQAYCRREGIALSRFYRWRGIAEGGRGQLSSSTRVPERASAESFIDLGLVSAAGGARLELKFDLGGGMTLTVTR